MWHVRLGNNIFEYIHIKGLKFYIWHKCTWETKQPWRYLSFTILFTIIIWIMDYIHVILKYFLPERLLNSPDWIVGQQTLSPFPWHGVGWSPDGPLHLNYSNHTGDPSSKKCPPGDLRPWSASWHWPWRRPSVRWWASESDGRHLGLTMTPGPRRKRQRRR